MTLTHEINLNEIPIDALQPETRNELSKQLNVIICLPSDEGVFRDWRGIADRIGLDNSIVTTIKNKTDPMDHCLQIWSKQKGKEANLGQLQIYLQSIDRYDVVSDTKKLFDNDASEYLKRLNREHNEVVQSESGILHSNYLSNECIVKEDIKSLRTNSPKIRFNGFVLHAKEDTNFALEIVGELERREYKVCLKDRDFICGIPWEHEAVIDAMKRSDSVIIIASQAFIRPEYVYYTNYALALAIEQNKHNIIVCMYSFDNRVQLKKCLPKSLQYGINYLQYQNDYYNFWDKLIDSVDRAKVQKKKIIDLKIDV